jgi:hypothetical protein
MGPVLHFRTIRPRSKCMNNVNMGNKCIYIKHFTRDSTVALVMLKLI